MTDNVKQEQENQNQHAEDTATTEQDQDTEVTEEQENSVEETETPETSEENGEVTETVESVETEAEEPVEEELEETLETDEAEEEIDEEDIPAFTGEMDDDKIYTLEELRVASEDYTDEEFHDLASMYEDTLNEIEEKEIVTGRVVSVDEKYVVVDIGFKSEGIIQVNEFPDKVVEDLAPGDEVEVFLDKVEDQEGQLILSRRKADILQAWETIERSHDTGEVLEGYIKRRIKGGMVVDIMGIDCFLPGSQIDVRPVRDFDAYVGKTMEFQVVKLNMQAENVVVSHRALIESDLEEQREEILSTIEEGQVLEGIVKNITDFGVFIDLGGVDGLLHITDLSWGRVEHPDEIVSLDQRMNVAVIDFDNESKRVSLGLKQLQPHPWNEIDLKYPEGIKVQGRVVSIADYGAFIELEKGVEGLIHISEMSWTQHIKHPSQLVSKDDIIECVVLNVNEPEKKISLGVKQLEKDPWEDIDERYPVGSKHTGTVRNLTNFGVFVELEPGIDGLIHVSDLSWTDKVNHPNEIIDKDQEIEVVILAIDFENRRITLGHKQIEENPWEKFAEEHGLGNQVEGEIYKITDKGLFVKLPYELEGFVPASKTEAGGDLSESYEVGSTVEAYVIELDESNKNLTLSQRQKDSQKVKPTKSEDRGSRDQKVERGTPTLGEMSGLADLKREMEEKEKKEREAAKQLEQEAQEKAEAKKKKEQEAAEAKKKEEEDKKKAEAQKNEEEAKAESESESEEEESSDEEE